MTGAPEDPIFDEADAAPMPPETPWGHCPNCGVKFLVALAHATENDYAVCASCAQIMVIMENGQPRLPSFDEICEAELHPMVQFMVQMARPAWMNLPPDEEPPP